MGTTHQIMLVKPPFNVFAVICSYMFVVTAASMFPFSPEPFSFPVLSSLISILQSETKLACPSFNHLLNIAFILRLTKNRHGHCIFSSTSHFSQWWPVPFIAQGLSVSNVSSCSYIANDTPTLVDLCTTHLGIEMDELRILIPATLSALSGACYHKILLYLSSRFGYDEKIVMQVMSISILALSPQCYTNGSVVASNSYIDLWGTRKKTF